MPSFRYSLFVIRHWRLLPVAGAALLVALGGPLMGCHTPREAERFGKVYYLDGAGNWGWGTRGVTRGLEEAGYRGDVEVFAWTMSLNPLLDQLIPLGGRLRAGTLARKIERYRQMYPDTGVHLIALSAGAGPALWTVENLRDGAKIDNLILLGATLSAQYDLSRALANMRGDIYNYHSPHDGMLDGLPTFTVDGRIADAAGLVGLHPAPWLAYRVHNLEWRAAWAELGWDGGHLGSASVDFVRNVVARHVMERDAVNGPTAEPANAR